METQEKIKNLKKSTYKKISVKDFENFKDINSLNLYTLLKLHQLLYSNHQIIVQSQIIPFN